MISRTVVSHRLTSVGALALGALACVAVALALSPTRAFAEPCTNEQQRKEGNIDPSPAAEGKSYSQLLPDCRAYEMVSPLEKGGLDAGLGPFHGIQPVAIAPGGETAAWSAPGLFSNPENFRVNGDPTNIYLSQRGASGWSTSSALAPKRLVETPFLTIKAGLDGDSTPDLRSVRASCGAALAIKGEHPWQAVTCARLKLGGEWGPDPLVSFTEVEGEIGAESEAFMGGAFPESGLSRVILHAQFALLPADRKGLSGGVGLYEIAGVGTASQFLRLVNVDNAGNVLLNVEEGKENAPLIGDFRPSGQEDRTNGSFYHAMSASGETVFFTASPMGSTIQTVFARIHCVVASSTCKEDGNSELLETVAVSNPTTGPTGECNACKVVTNPAEELKNATFVGASADGSKVFFTTTQKLLSEETEESGGGTTINLYEYDFNNPPHEKLVLLSPDPVGGEVSARATHNSILSSDGSHVYFIAGGVLTSGNNAEGQKPVRGGSNLYGYDTVTGETKLVTRAGPSGAQTTPDGRFLVFSAAAKLAGDTNSAGAAAVYRYDFQTGTMTWISRPAPGFTPTNEGKSAGVPALLAGVLGAFANVDDWGRAISGCPEEVSRECSEKGAHDGEYIIFTTTETLQATHELNSLDVYAWHCASPCEHPSTEGSVGMISGGRDLGGVAGPGGLGGENVAAMSASGADILFSTHTPLVGQDSDVLRDYYDARVGGGFPAPSPAPSCAGEACQPESRPPVFGAPTSSAFTAGGNLPPLAGGVLAFHTSKPPTRAQQLAKALKACRGKPKKKRAACESQARKKYGVKAKAKKTLRRSK